MFPLWYWPATYFYWPVDFQPDLIVADAIPTIAVIVYGPTNLAPLEADR